MVAEKNQSFAHLANKALDGSFRSFKIMLQFRCPRHDAALAYGEIAQERNDVGADVDQEHTAEADVFVYESDNRAGNHPSALHASQQERVRRHELAFGREFLDERGDGRPEHPEAGGDQRVHQIELPDLNAAAKGQYRDHENDDGARGVEHHDQSTAVFAVNDYAREWQHEHGGERLQNSERAQRHLRMRSLQNRPRDGSGVHAAAQHGDHVGRKNESQPAFLQNRAHDSNLTWGGRLFGSTRRDGACPVSARATYGQSRRIRGKRRSTKSYSVIHARESDRVMWARRS